MTSGNRSFEIENSKKVLYKKNKKQGQPHCGKFCRFGQERPKVQNSQYIKDGNLQLTYQNFNNIQFMQYVKFVCICIYVCIYKQIKLQNRKMLPTGMIGINYMAGLGLKNIINQHQSSEDKYQGFHRQKSYMIESDWEINTENGGYKLISKEKKKNQGKIVKFVLKKFITTGSFMGLSFPVFAMKPESILETYGKSIAAAPLFFDNIEKDPSQRMKKFVAFTFTFSRLFTDMDKPFNPVIGQTFQSRIAGGLYSAEQTSHHPPQSSFHFEGNGYTLYATLELGADIGVNSANGYFIGEIHVEFHSDSKLEKGHIFGRFLGGEMSGFVVGENKFRPSGSSYAYDPHNKIICSYKRETKDYFKGQLGILRKKYQNRFDELLKTKDRFTKFEAFKQKDFECIISHMSACWTKYVSFNQKHYLDFMDHKWLPFEPTSQNLKLLPSDSRNRKDIQLRAKHEIKESQQQKQQIEKQQRYYRKLRKGEKNINLSELNCVDNLEQAQLNNDV